MKRIVVAIDGYSACGKSTTARALAGKLNYTYVDSGSMYRAVTLYFIRNHTDLNNSEDVRESLSNISLTFDLDREGNFHPVLNGKNVNEEIRSMDVSNNVSAVSTLKAVRDKVVALQRELGKDKGIVMDGRDIGTVVFPDAEVKIFMIAEFDIRAQRRLKEIREKGMEVTLEEVKINLHQRDQLDTTREISPLVKADDAVIIDNSYLSFEEQVHAIHEIALKVVNA